MKLEIEILGKTNISQITISSKFEILISPRSG